MVEDLLKTAIGMVEEARRLNSEDCGIIARAWVVMAADHLHQAFLELGGVEDAEPPT